MSPGFRMSSDMMYTQCAQQGGEFPWNSGNFQISPHTPRNPFCNVQQSFNSDASTMQRNSPLLQVPQITQSQHNMGMGGARNVNHSMQATPTQQQMMNSMFNNPMAYSMGHFGHPLQNPMNQPQNPMNPQMRPHQQMGGASLPSSITQRSPSHPNSPACGQVTSSTDVNRSVQTDTNFYPTIHPNFAHPNMHQRAMHPSMMTSQEHVMLTSQNMERSVSMTTDTSNMVVRDMGSSLSQLPNETQFLQRK